MAAIPEKVDKTPNKVKKIAIKKEKAPPVQTCISNAFKTGSPSSYEDASGSDVGVWKKDSARFEYLMRKCPKDTKDFYNGDLKNKKASKCAGKLNFIKETLKNSNFI